MFIDYISYFFLFLGCFILFSSSIGLIRFPDFYTRLHAAGKTDSLGQVFILLALLFFSDFDYDSIKILAIIFFILIFSPVSTHALAHSASLSGLKPKVFNRQK